MPPVFFHGVPETTAMWKPIRSLLRCDSIALGFPGFGCPRPDGFGATIDDYAQWLVIYTACVEGPIDLVGHD